MLDEQAEEMARQAKEQLGGGQSPEGFVYNEAYYNAFSFATRTALEVERDAYLAIKEALSIALRDYPDEAGDESLYVTQLRAIGYRLRTRLGITE